MSLSSGVQSPFLSWSKSELPRVVLGHLQGKIFSQVAAGNQMDILLHFDYFPMKSMGDITQLRIIGIEVRVLLPI